MQLHQYRIFDLSDKVVILYHHSAYIIYSAILQFNAEIFVPFVVISNLGAIIYYVALKRTFAVIASINGVFPFAYPFLSVPLVI